MLILREMPIKAPPRASGVVHCPTIRLQGRGHHIDSTSGEIPYVGVNEAQDSQLLQSPALKPGLPKMRGHHNESLPTTTTEEPLLAALGEKPGQQGRPSTAMESTN